VIVHRKGATSAREGETGIIPCSQETEFYFAEGDNVVTYTNRPDNLSFNFLLNNAYINGDRAVPTEHKEKVIIKYFDDADNLLADKTIEKVPLARNRVTT